MLVHEAYRVELDFTAEQEVLFRKHCGMTRYVFNWALAKWIAWWEANKELPKESRSKRPSAYDLSREFTATKPEWTEELIANVRTYALAAAEDAYKNFFRRLVEKTKAGKGYGFPRFKKKGKSRDAFTLQDQAFRAQPRAIKLAKIGMVKTKQYVAPTPDEKGAECLRSGKHRYLEGRVLRIVVSRWADSWYASIMVERNRPDPLPVRGPVVGVDFGTNHRITTSDGFQDAPGRDLERKLKRLEHLQHLFQRKLDGDIKGEKRRDAMRNKIARLHKEVAQARADTIHKLTHRLATTCSTIIVEGFQIDRLVEKRRRKIKGWRRREARRRIYEASWGELRRQLEYKTKWYGSTLVVTEPFEATDRECHACGFVNEPPPHPTNDFRCTSCGTSTTRQLNTALRQYQVGT
jgi:putative transposase